jgi:hypothetical protein
MKKCYKCKKEKPLYEYSKDAKTIDKLYQNCKDCVSKMSKEYRLKMKEGVIKAF